MNAKVNPDKTGKGKRQMYRVMIVDDEPLILAGIASLLDWNEYGCEISGNIIKCQFIEQNRISSKFVNNLLIYFVGISDFCFC